MFVKGLNPGVISKVGLVLPASGKKFRKDSDRSLMEWLLKIVLGKIVITNNKNETKNIDWYLYLTQLDTRLYYFI